MADQNPVSGAGGSDAGRPALPNLSMPWMPMGRWPICACAATSSTPATGFRGALVLYPACGLKGQFNDGILSYAPVRLFQGSADQEVSPRRCGELVARSRALGGDIQFRLYPEATHDFDDPSPSHRDNDANATATEDVIARGIEFLASVLKP